MPMPATASISPFAGSIATIPPSCPPSASPRRAAGSGRSWCAPPGSASATALASTRLPASSSPPGVPRRRSSSASSSPLVPTIASAGTPSASSSLTRALGIGPTSPTTAAAAAPSGELRAPAAVAGPSASTDPSRASSAARGGSVMRLLSDSPARRPGKTSECDQITRAPPGSSCTIMSKLSASVPHSRVSTRIGTEIDPVRTFDVRCPSPSCSSRSPCARPPGRRRRMRSREMRRCAAASMSSYIVA